MQKYMLISFGLQAFSKFATVTALKLLFLLNHPDVHFKISIFDGQKFSFISEQSMSCPVANSSPSFRTRIREDIVFASWKRKQTYGIYSYIYKYQLGGI